MRVEKPPMPIKQPVEEPQPFGRVVLLLVLVILSAGLFWFAWHNALTSGVTLKYSSANLIVILTTLAAFCLMFCLLALAAVVIKNSLWVMAASLLAGASLFIFFKVSLWSVLAMLIMFLAFGYWRREVRLDVKTRIKFLPQRIISSGLKTTITLVLVSSCLVFYGWQTTRPDYENKIRESVADSGTRAVSNVLDMYYKEKFNPEMTLDEFILTMGFTSLDELTASGQELLPDEVKFEKVQQLIDQGLNAAQEMMVAKARAEFLQTFGIEGTGEEKMESILRKIVVKNIDQYLSKYLKYLPILTSIALYFILNIFNFLYTELIKSLSFIVFRILVWMKLLKVKKVQVESEQVTL